ncbi:MAG: hypothetical protein ACYS74_11605, partial [Planctomycetota bacterium]
PAGSTCRAAKETPKKPRTRVKNPFLHTILAHRDHGPPFLNPVFSNAIHHSSLPRIVKNHKSKPLANDNAKSYCFYKHSVSRPPNVDAFFPRISLFFQGGQFTRSRSPSRAPARMCAKGVKKSFSAQKQRFTRKAPLFSIAIPPWGNP